MRAPLTGRVAVVTGAGSGIGRGSASRWIGILVNNAGLQHAARIEEFPLERWTRLISVMLTGPFLCTRAALPYMRRAAGRL